MPQAGTNDLINVVETFADCIENEQIDTAGCELINDYMKDLKDSLEDNLNEDACDPFKNVNVAINKIVDDQSCASIQDLLKLGITAKTPLLNAFRELCQQLRQKLTKEAGDKLFSSVIDHYKSKELEERYKPLMKVLAEIEASCSIPQSDNSMTSYTL